MRLRYRLAEGKLMDCCGITHGRELLCRQAALEEQAAGRPKLPPQLACMMGRTPGPTHVQAEQVEERRSVQGAQLPQVQQQQQLGQGQQTQWPEQQQVQQPQTPAGAQ